ncbi:hypothetical protein [uncultured Vagococcus sp.]|uniref:hypothetical protein n=1 Tax=uncultured Vagococcus sp. TaxID=189676 RepID=UPI0028D27F18|nr:hypothetical protein [uncultured Vagococcus sp.]
MNKAKLIITPDKEFVQVYKERLDKEIKGTAKDNFLSMVTTIADDGLSITAVVVSPDKESIDNFVGYLIEFYDGVVTE